MTKIGNEDIFLSDTGGDKLALLFVHGIALDHTVWQSQIGSFSPEYRVVCVDLRGYGRSTAANPNISFEDHAGDLATLIDGLGLKNVTLIGLVDGRRHRSIVRRDLSRQDIASCTRCYDTAVFSR